MASGAVKRNAFRVGQDSGSMLALALPSLSL